MYSNVSLEEYFFLFYITEKSFNINKAIVTFTWKYQVNNILCSNACELLLIICLFRIPVVQPNISSFHWKCSYYLSLCYFYVSLETCRKSRWHNGACWYTALNCLFRPASPSHLHNLLHPSPHTCFLWVFQWCYCVPTS